MPDKQPPEPLKGPGRRLDLTYLKLKDSSIYSQWCITATFFKVYYLTDTTADIVVAQLKAYFAGHGILVDQEPWTN